VHWGQWLLVLVVGLALTLSGSLVHAGEPPTQDTEQDAATSSTGPGVEYSFYQPEYAGGDYYYYAAYLGLWSTGQFKLILRGEEQYRGAVYQCDRVWVLILYGDHYTASNGQVTYPGTGTYDVTDTCTPSLNQHQRVTQTWTWAYRLYKDSQTAYEFINKAYAFPYNDFVFRRCIPGTNCQQHVK
jgi:hypothetical protein